MSRRPTPWQGDRRVRTSRGLVTKLIRASLVLGVLSMLFGAEPVSADTAITYTISGIVGTNGWFKGSAGGIAPSRVRELARLVESWPDIGRRQMNRRHQRASRISWIDSGVDGPRLERVRTFLVHDAAIRARRRSGSPIAYSPERD